jgi:glutamate N-acetyltransferase/amino-acid N-acetyltransferase
MSTIELESHVIEEIEGNITAAAGFRAAGIHCGIKRRRKDLGLIVSDCPATAAGVFTRNRVKAAPVLVSRQRLDASPQVSAIVVNSGNANACTGERGLADAREMCRGTAEDLGLREEEVLVCSTGVIGEALPMDRIRTGISAAAAALSPSGGIDAAEAILTTDTFVKHTAVAVEGPWGRFHIGGIAKGSGMIHPNMATMLAFLTTDARVSPSLLRRSLRRAVDRSFNCISVDGDMSTNDTVLLLANGTSGVNIDDDRDARSAFAEALEHVCVALAQQIVRDGEGATKVIEVVVNGAFETVDARELAQVIATSSLVKTAVHGADANWGRILAAMGGSSVAFDPEKVEIYFDDLPILLQGFCAEFDEVVAAAVLSKPEVRITVELNLGSSSATFWTCDLTEEYVRINASYRS